MRIDSHQHFWRYSPAEYGWMDDRMTRIRRDFLPEDLAPLLAACGLDGAVAVQARSSLEETRFLLDLAREHDCVKGVVGWADLCALDLDAVLDELCQEPLLRGLRHVVQDEPDDDFLRREDFQAGARKLAARSLVYDILIYPRQLDAAVAFAAALPDQPFVLDHLAKPDIAGARTDNWRGGFRGLAAMDHVLRKVNGIVLMPVDGTALARVAEEAQQAGIPVVIADSGLEWEGQVSFVATDNREAGRIAGRRLRELMGGAGKAVMMRYVEGSESTKQREEGFLEGVAEQQGVELLSTNQHAGNTKEGAQAVAENLLTANPGVTGVFCSNESATHGMLRALEAAGLAGKVRFVGFDSSGTLLEGLRAGHIDALVLQDPVHMGDTAVRTLVDHLDGEDVERRVDTGVTVATKDNLDSAEIAGLLTPDLSILDGR